MQLGKESSSISYGFRQAAIEEIKKLALGYRNAVLLQANVAEIERRQNLLDLRLAQESFRDYLEHACPVDLTRKDAEVCRTHPQYFLWPSDKFFVHYRPQ
jgi:hypothetical protein